MAHSSYPRLWGIFKLAIDRKGDDVCAIKMNNGKADENHALPSFFICVHRVLEECREYWQPPFAYSYQEPLRISEWCSAHDDRATLIPCKCPFQYPASSLQMYAVRNGKLSPC